MQQDYKQESLWFLYRIGSHRRTVSRRVRGVATGSRGLDARDHSPAPPNFYARLGLGLTRALSAELRCPLPRPLAAGQNTSKTARTDQIKCRPTLIRVQKYAFWGGSDCVRNRSPLETVSSDPTEITSTSSLFTIISGRPRLDCRT
jgi:hypothetical protein